MPQTRSLPVKSKLLFLALLVIMFFVYRYPYSIRKGPYSIHMWRQSDCLSIAKNYLEEGFHFFQPTIHWISLDHKDQAVSELPLLNYIVALLWGLFGQHEFIYRLLSLLIVYLGLYYLFRFTFEVTSDRFWAFFVPLLLFTSPILVFYGNNFLSNAPSFGLALTALYFYWRFVRTNKVKHLYISLFIYLLAGLLKVTALLSFAAILVIHSASRFEYFRNAFRIQRIGRPIHLLPMIGVPAIIIIWSWWAKQYNSQTGYFVVGMKPVWDLANLYDGLYYGTRLYTALLPAYFNQPALFIILALFAWLLVKFRRTDRLLVSLTGLILIGMLCYVVLFMEAFGVHDYYLINLLIFIPLVVIAFLHYLRENKIRLFYSRAFRGLAVVALVALVYYAMVIQRMRYDLRDTFVKHTIIVDEQEKAYWRYIQGEYERRYRPLESITPYLRELGIQRTDLVLCLSDPTPNESLYMMDQKGRTGFGFFDRDGTNHMDQFMRSGMQYLIITDPGLLNSDYIQPYLEDKIGEYKNVLIFRLKSPAGDL